MQGVLLHERIVFLFFEPARGVEALFVARRGVARCGFARGFRLGAFKGDDVSWHFVLFLRVGGCRLFFLGFAAFFVGQTEERCD